MKTISAATGRFGRHVVEALLRRGAPAGEIVAAVCSPVKAAAPAATLKRNGLP
jgi:NAD(P)H dehydrogenase (quinone)